MTLFDRFGPWRTKKGRQRPRFDCFAHNVTTTVSMSWEGFFLSWEGRFIAGGGNLDGHITEKKLPTIGWGELAGLLT